MSSVVQMNLLVGPKLVSAMKSLELLRLQLVLFVLLRVFESLQLYQWVERLHCVEDVVLLVVQKNLLVDPKLVSPMKSLDLSHLQLVLIVLLRDFVPLQLELWVQRLNCVEDVMSSVVRMNLPVDPKLVSTMKSLEVLHLQLVLFALLRDFVPLQLKLWVERLNCVEDVMSLVVRMNLTVDPKLAFALNSLGALAPGWI